MLDEIAGARTRHCNTDGMSHDDWLPRLLTRVTPAQAHNTLARVVGGTYFIYVPPPSGEGMNSSLHSGTTSCLVNQHLLGLCSTAW